MASPAAAGVGEHATQIQGMPDDAAATGNGPVDDGRVPRSVGSLNLFVCFAANAELAGDAVGAFASLWASVVLLAGYGSSLERIDFWIATVITFLETFRVLVRKFFSSGNRSLFGRTRAFGGLSSSFARILWRPQEGSATVLIIGWLFMLIAELPTYIPTVMILKQVLLIGMGGAHLHVARQMRHPNRTLLWVLVSGVTVMSWVPHIVAIAVASVTFAGVAGVFALVANLVTRVVAVALLSSRPRVTGGTNTRLLLYLLKAISVVLLTYTWATTPTSLLLQFGSQQRWAPRPDPSPFELVPGLALPLATVVLLFGTPQDHLFGQCIDMIMHISYLLALVSPLSLSNAIVLLAVLLIRNLQITEALAQLLISLWRIGNLPGGSPNMVACVRIFYFLEVLQASFYIVAWISVPLTYMCCKRLADSLLVGLEDKWRAKVIDMYYDRAYTARMATGMFGEDKISLASFVVDSLSSASGSRQVQLAGVSVLHSFLQQRDSNKEQISEITRSEKAIPTLISMLGWTSEQDRDSRLLAAKVTAELSSCVCDLGINIAGIPGAVKSVSLLLDAENKPASGNDDGILLVSQAAGGNEIIGGSTGNDEPMRIYILPETNVTDNQSPDQECADGNGVNAGNHLNENLLRREQLGHRGGNNSGGWWWTPLYQWMKEFNKAGSPLPCHGIHETLPILGMEILESLACDADNCTEIVETTGLIPKITGLISYNGNDEGSTDNASICSSLSLVRRLAATGGKIGATLRQELWDSPFLLSNLICIMDLEDSESSRKALKLAMDIIANLALDKVIRQELGNVQVIIHKLMQVFIIGDGATNYEQELRVAAGGALANISMERPANFLAILEMEERPGYVPVLVLVEDMKVMLGNRSPLMLGNDGYIYVVATLLQNLCGCSSIRDRLRDPAVLSLVLENI